MYFSDLKERKFVVCSVSDIFQISFICAGVPQGAVITINLLLFNLYISNQPTTDYTITADFAEDKAFLTLHSNSLNLNSIILKSISTLI